jgi:hypothetical protein
MVGNESGNGQTGAYGQAWATSNPGALAAYCAARNATAACAWQRPDSFTACDADAPASDCVIRYNDGVWHSFGAVGWHTRTGAYCSSCTTGTGVTTTRNVTIGYAGQDYDTTYGSPNGGLDFLPDGTSNTSSSYPVVPSSFCVNMCTMSVGAATGTYWQSRMPTPAGMYRMSADYLMTSTGAECTQSPNDSKFIDGTMAAPSTCTGSMGYVNGKAVCIRNDNQNVVKAIPADKNRTEGNPAAGTDATTPLSSRISNPSDAGNKGGPPGPRDGVVVTPTGTVLSPTATTASPTTTPASGTVQVACGAPGQPACKIDEAGTKVTASMTLDEAGVTSDASTKMGTVAGTGDKTWLSGWSNLWGAPPVASCTPIVYPPIKVGGADIQPPSLNPCPVVDGMRLVMAFVWALGGFWLCLGMVREVI